MKNINQNTKKVNAKSSVSSLGKGKKNASESALAVSCSIMDVLLNDIIFPIILNAKVIIAVTFSSFIFFLLSNFAKML